MPIVTMLSTQNPIRSYSSWLVLFPSTTFLQLDVLCMFWYVEGEVFHVENLEVFEFRVNLYLVRLIDGSYSVGHILQLGANVQM